MKIILKNFKCWENNTFTIDDNGIHLINGSSGKGKSSILDAIYFCLYGNLQKITTYGKKSCQVTIHYDQFTISRTKCPNRLVVTANEEEMEDEIAQKFIDKYFGEYFFMTSYVKQNINQTFIYMSPTEKLEFLENYVLGHFNVNKIKDKIKDDLRSNEKELDILSGQYQTYKDLLQNTKKPEIVEFPIKCKEKYIPIVSKNERTKKKNNLILLGRKKKELNTFRENYLKTKKIQDEMLILKSKIEELEKSKSSEEEKNDIEYDREKTRRIKVKIDGLKRYLEYDCLKKQLDKENDLLSIKFSEELNHLESELTSDKYNFQEEDIQKIEKGIEIINNKITAKKQIIKIQEELENFQSETDYTQDDVKEIETEIMSLKKDYELSKKKLSCPNCNCSLILSENKLKSITSGNLSDTTYKNQIKEKQDLLNEINPILMEMEMKNKLEHDLEKITPISEEMETLVSELNLKKKKFKNLIELITEKKRLLEIKKSNNFPSLLRHKEIIKNIETKLKKYSDITIPDSINLEELEEELKQSMIKDFEFKKHKETLYKLDEDLTKNKDKVVKLTSEIENIDEKTTSEEIILGEIKKLEKEIEENMEIIEKIVCWEKNKEEVNNYQMLSSKMEELTSKTTLIEKKIKNLNALKNKLIQAESISITNFIESINIHTQIYLDHFFKTDQIFVNIQTHKETKKSSKPQINLNIEYKGNQVELSNLSGGERDRINLAFTLAFSEIFNSPILLLDECISSLDYENCCNVLQTIRENYKGKCVLCVHHQSNEGLFDSILNV